jgi:4a-hydroxytetrahydrobiopterin dehydratase
LIVVKISTQEANKRLEKLPGWALEGSEITKRFEFKDFLQAFTFMVRVAKVAEAMGHHPNWSNVYNVVEVRLSTHSVQGLTEKDFEMAAAMNELSA